MKYYELINRKSRAVEVLKPHFDKKVDLLVVGLGSAGSYCALAAAQEGASVLGVDRGNCAGGMSVQGAVNGYYNGYPGGLFESVDESVSTLTGRVYRYFHNHPDPKKNETELRLLDAGVEISLKTIVVGLYVEDRRVIGAKLLNGGRTLNIKCTYLSDSTSDGHILHILGIQTKFGRNTDGSTQPFSSVRIFKRADGNLGRTNDDSGYINQYDDFEFSQRVIQAHAKHTDYSDPENERFLFVAPQIGIRGGVRFKGEETITMQDIIDIKDYDRVLTCAYSDIDRHGRDYAFDEKLYQDWFVLSNLSTVTMKIRIPMGAIIPEGWNGILSVSRCLSVDDYASSAVRMNRDMYRLGESTGVAIAMAVRDEHDDILKIDIDAFYKNVQARNCFDPRPEQIRGFVDQNALEPYKAVEWLTDWQEIATQLSTDRPGVAMWSSKLLGLDKVGDALVDLTLSGESEKQRYNAALTLGLLGDSRSIPVLREIVRNRSAYHFEDCRRTNQIRSVNAICLLGRFADREILPELIDILQDEEYEKDMYHTYIEPSYKFNIVKEINSVYYQHFAFALTSIGQILDEYPELRSEVGQKIKAVFEDKLYFKRMTDSLEGSTYDLIVKNLGEYANAILL